jgi:hypothetical protein
MECIHGGFVPFLLNMFFLLPLSFVDGWHTRQIPNYPTRKSPETADPLMKLVIPHSCKSAQGRPNFSCDRE